MRKFLFIAAFVVLPWGLSAAQLTLRDGSVLYGRFVSGNEQGIVFQDNTGVRRRFDINQVQSLDFQAASAPAYNGPEQGYPPPLSGGERNRGDWAVLRPGTTLAVRTDQRIDAQSAEAGRTYPATIMEDVLDERGQMVIPHGAPAQLVVRQVNEGGTLQGGSFVLDLDSVRVNGRRYVVSTTDIEAGNQNGIGKNKRTAEMVGGGAVLGTLIGALAGGGKGAAIGALGGAVAGGGVQVATKGHEIRVPAETVLNFRLDRPLHLREAQ